jgi:hypothetical protein
MKVQHTVILSLIFLLSFVGFEEGHAQAYIDRLFNEYLAKPQLEPNSLYWLNQKTAEANYQQISLNEPAMQQLMALIADHHQDKVRSIFFVVNERTELAKVFSLLRQFPNLESIDFYDDGESKIKRHYQLPEEIIQLKKIKGPGDQWRAEPGCKRHL